jgi:hypothetical protein
MVRGNVTSVTHLNVKENLMDSGKKKKFISKHRKECGKKNRKKGF